MEKNNNLLLNSFDVNSVDNSIVKLFLFLLRGCEDIEKIITKCIENAGNEKSQAPQIIADLFVLCFQTRDCRGGKGERNISYLILITLYKIFPETTISVLPFLAEYGYYKDYINMMELYESNSSFVENLCQVFANQLIKDENIVNANQEKKVSKVNISLCAKYAPREGKHFAQKFPNIFKILLEKLGKGRSGYRKMISKLTEALDVPEVKMCKRLYSEIDFSMVPSICLKRNVNAFLGLKQNTEYEFSKDFNEDRSKCRNNLLNSIHDINSDQIYAEELVHKILERDSSLSEQELELIEVQWNNIRNNLIDSSKRQDFDNGVNLFNIVPMADLSSSMKGKAMEIAIAFSILISEINHHCFRNKLLTFDTEPAFVSLENAQSFKEKIEIISQLPWAGTTNIDKAFELIISEMKEINIKADEIPTLLIFTDMDFDIATPFFSSQMINIEQRFSQLGLNFSTKLNSGFRIIFWNLGQHQTKSNISFYENVQFLSGYSPSLLKHLFNNSSILNEPKTPGKLLRQILNDTRYDPIRQVLHSSQEKELAFYSFNN